ncbi:MAG TPA: endolytic transglycosylase MltG [Bacteroidales bacterium]|nr:endolytic transglycosylase MltG [Bacteroidales bacterium]HOX74913.1 endolytic transglycosylase MltG [Bacteroidales bacterium]HPM88197.1 endolytic transglycosylase MltG [Bacteroidales bacterium]HQM69123.1 endolytic transglycosylase MltG [Bacteroidales bacterium]
MINRTLKFLLIFSGLLIFAGIILIFSVLFGLNIVPAEKEIVLYIPESASYSQAMDSIKAHTPVKHPAVFDWIARRKNYPVNVKPGRYVIRHKMSYVEAINMFRSGDQAPVNVTFNNIRTLYDLAGKIGGQISADSTAIADFFNDTANYSGDGFSRENIISVFIPNTYQFFWNTNAKELYRRMLKENRKFWNDERKSKAEAIGMTPAEVSTLASIVDDEAGKADEKPRIAGVYLNRLKRGIPLQADPTIKFALNDFSLTRILKKHLQIDSPYNTYLNGGLPPGPIGCPTIESIDAVLNAEKHDFLYFVAKADFSGYHHFSRTLSEHNRFAAIYQRELNKRKIFR